MLKKHSAIHHLRSKPSKYYTKSTPSPRLHFFVSQSFSSTVFGRSSYQFPFVSMFHSCSLHIPHSRQFDFQVFSFRELLKFFCWHIYVCRDGGVLKIQYLVVWSLIIISGLLCLRALPVLIIDTPQIIATMSFSFTAFGWSS